MTAANASTNSASLRPRPSELDRSGVPSLDLGLKPVVDRVSVAQNEDAGDLVGIRTRDAGIGV
jgi:hypothetical protein